MLKEFVLHEHYFTLEGVRVQYLGEHKVEAHTAIGEVATHLIPQRAGTMYLFTAPAGPHLTDGQDILGKWEIKPAPSRIYVDKHGVRWFCHNADYATNICSGSNVPIEYLKAYCVKIFIRPGYVLKMEKQRKEEERQRQEMEYQNQVSELDRKRQSLDESIAEYKRLHPNFHPEWGEMVGGRTPISKKQVRKLAVCWHGEKPRKVWIWQREFWCR